MGMRLTCDKFKEYAVELLTTAGTEGCVDKALAEDVLADAANTDKSQDAIEAMRAKVEKVKVSERLRELSKRKVKNFLHREKVPGRSRKPLSVLDDI